MTRPINAAALAAMKSESAEFVHLLEFTFSGGAVRLNTGAQDLDWNGFTWEAVGGLLQFGGVQETSDMSSQGVDVQLSGVDQTVLSVLMTNAFRGRQAKIYRAHLDRATGLVVDSPLLLFQGLQLSPYTVEEDQASTGSTVQISTRLVGFFGVDRVRGIVSNLASHQQYFNGDLFFQHTSALDTTNIYWAQAPVGGKAVKKSGPGSPGTRGNYTPHGAVNG